MKTLLSLIFMCSVLFADTPPVTQVKSKTLDGTGAPITSTTSGPKTGLDVNIVGGGGSSTVNQGLKGTSPEAWYVQGNLGRTWSLLNSTDSVNIGNFPSTYAVVQSTSPWVVSGTVNSVQSGVWTTARTWSLLNTTDSVNVGNFPSTFGVTQSTSPWVVSGASLTSIDSKLTDGTQRTKITDGTNNAALSNTSPIGTEQSLIVRNIPSGTQTISGSVSITGAVPLPTGAATEATLSALNGKFNSLGQKAMSGSVPVAIASDQSAVPSSQSGTWANRLQDGSGNAITSQTSGSQRPLDVGVNVAGVQVDPRSIRALTSADVVTAQQGSPPWSVVGNIASGSADSGNPVKVGGVYNTTLPVLSSGQRSDVQFDSSGRLIFRPLTSGTDSVTSFQGGTWTSGRTWTLLNTTDSVNIGNFPATFGVTQSTSPWVVSGSGNFTVVQPTGTSLHTVLDTTSTTAVTQATAANLNATVVQSSGTNLHVNVDSAPTTTVTGTVTANAGTNLNTSALALSATQTDGTQKTKIVDGSNATVGPVTTLSAVNYMPVVTASSATPGAALVARSIQVAGSDGTNAQTISTDSTGKLNVNNISGTVSLPTGASTSANQTNGSQTTRITDGTNTAAVKAASTAAVASDPSLVVAMSPNSRSPLSQDTTSSGTITANGQTVTINPNGTGTVGVQITGSWIGTIEFEATTDGVTFFSVTFSGVPAGTLVNNIAANTNGRINSSGYNQVRLRASAWTSGTASISLIATQNAGLLRVFQTNPDSLLVGAQIRSSTISTYSAATLGLTVAATPTDVFTITGSASKTIKITQIRFSGTRTTNTTNDTLFLKRSTADTGGTSTSVTAVPNDSSNSAATGTVLAYTANPTVGTLVGNVRVDKTFLNAAATGIGDKIVYDWTYKAGQPIVLRGTSEVFAINLNSVSMAGSSLDISVEWTEE